MKKPPSPNAALYRQGRRYAKQVARHVERGVGPRAALQQAAADPGRDFQEVRSAVAFKAAVDVVAGHVGPVAKNLILCGPRTLAPRRVMRLARTHPDRQRYEIDQAGRGRPLFAKPPAGVDPPYDTLGLYEVVSRVERFAGLLGWVADGLKATPPEGWPGIGTLQALAARNAAIRESCEALQAALTACGTSETQTPAPGQHPSRPRRRRPPASPAPFNPGKAFALVSAARGVMEKNLRDAPRVFAESPPTARERAALLRHLRRLDSAAMRLSRVIRGHVATSPYQAPPCRTQGGGGVAAEAAGAVRVVDFPDGPADWGGTYVVVFRLAVDAADVVVGALGTFHFPAGFYCYVGTMFGPGGVRARTRRHRTPVKGNRKWNVDFFTPFARAVEVWFTHDPARWECVWSAALAASTAFDCPVPEFGARDCRKAPPLKIGTGVYRCASHLYRSLEPPDVRDFAHSLGRLAPGHGPVFRLRPGGGDFQGGGDAGGAPGGR